MRALEAFVSVAQAGSLSAAAASAGMSLAALSRRVQQLEQEVGTPLLQRLARGSVLTPAGERYYRTVQVALQSVRAATGALRASVDRPVVRVTTTSAFARSWLIPRLNRFEEANPEIDVDVHLSMAYLALDTGEIDVAIRMEDASRPAAHAVTQIPISLSPVCTPATAERVRSPEDLRKAQLLGPEQITSFWPEWLEALRLPFHDFPPIRLVDCDLLYETTLGSNGVAIGIQPIVAPLLADGRLVELFGSPLRSARSFNVYCRPTSGPGDVATVFSTWLKDEIQPAAPD